MSVFPVCPLCGNREDKGGVFSKGETRATLSPEPVKGEYEESLLFFVCGSCDTKFPAYSYHVGYPETFKSNVMMSASNAEHAQTTAEKRPG